MIVPNAYRGKRIGVFGLARTGQAAIEALAAGGAEVLAWDDDATRRARAGSRAADLYDLDFATLDALMLAPGVPLTHPAPHPLAGKAQAAGTPIIGDIEIFAAARTVLPDHAVVAITGTNGKSTTAALMAHVATACGRPAALGGNIGVPVLSLEPLDEGGIYVFELSSFQIDLTHGLDPEVAILLNITPDHLDRHGDFNGYIASKRRLFEMQRPPHIAIVGVDDAPGREIATALEQPVIRISVRRTLDDGVFVDRNGVLVDAREGTVREVADLSSLPTLQGRHNWQNAAAVYAAGMALGLRREDIIAALPDFPGLAHRCEFLGARDGVRFINDSKATNMDAAATALAAFDRIRWIAGGRAKSADISAIEPYLGRIERAYLIGEAAAGLATALDGRVAHVRCGTVEQAVEDATGDARPGETILFSPGCASFDQFADFEQRGDAFRRSVRSFIEGGRP